MTNTEFQESFKQLTASGNGTPGFDPFPWQERLFALFVRGEFAECKTCSLPTGLGKTALLVIWLIALAKKPSKVPRRLVYVVNRRTVVDQTTDEAVRLRNNLERVPELKQSLADLCAIRDPGDLSFCPLAISTLRGQFADNQEWSTDPTRPAIVSGTVDMIGSRLLFNGYRCGFKSKPLHAGFLGTDVLLIHDEAHLEPAFQKLLVSLENEQVNGRFPERDQSRRLRIIELTATSRQIDESAASDAFGLNDEDRDNDVVSQRINARKGITFPFDSIEKESDVAERVAKLALEHNDTGAAVVVFVRKVDDVKKVVEQLSKERDKKLPTNVAQLTGTIRGLERDRLAKENPVFQRFLPESNRNKEIEPTAGTVYLVANAAGEVGVNISADHMVCDLCTFESAAQRLGRVNRFGEGDASIDIVVPESITKADPSTLKPLEVRMQRTYRVLSELPERADGRLDASPAALDALPPDKRQAAFSPTPEVLHADEVLFDAWSMTTLTMPSLDDIPGRPHVEDWLHGVQEDDIPQAQVAWREEVERVTTEVLAAQPKSLTREQMLQAYPLKPHELLQDSVDRIFKALVTLAKKADTSREEGAKTIPVWIVGNKGKVEPSDLLSIADPNAKGNDAKRLRNNLTGKIILLPPSVGGLDEGMFVGAKSRKADDVSDELRDEAGEKHRKRYEGDRPRDTENMRIVLRVHLQSDDDESSDETRVWTWLVRRRDVDDDSLSWTSRKKQLLDVHLFSAESYAKRSVDAMQLDDDLKRAVVIATKHHDLGKRRQLWQHGIGNREYDPTVPSTIWAKSGTFHAPVNKHYRHEFGSLSDILNEPDFDELDSETQELVLHLIAAHHGRARPHFPSAEAFDPEATEVDSEAVALEVPPRFGRLQRKYGCWQLAWLESLVRAADYLASQKLVDDATSNAPIPEEAES